MNGVAYRSADGNACGVKRLTKTLPSAQFHRNWLRDILAPLAVRGERFVVVHRSGRWNSAEHALQGVPSAIFSSCPRNRDLTPAEFAATREYLRER